MRKYTVALFVASGLALMAVLPASAQVVPPHQHFLVSPEETLIPIGPDACLFGPSRAFDEFHFNIHFGTPNLEAWSQASNPVSLVAPVPCP
jgi:hypothetical protein